MTVLDQIKKSRAIIKKDLSIYYLKGPVIIFGLLLPGFLFVSFAIGRNMSLEFLFPGLLGMALFFTTTAIGPVIAPWETRMRTLERIISAPISLWVILLGDIIASLMFGLVIFFVLILLGVFFLGLGILNLYLVIGTVMAAFCYSAFGLILSAPPTDNPSNIMMLSNLIKFPLIFVSGIFVPIQQMPGITKILSFISPLTYYTDLARYSIQRESYFSPLLNLAVIVGFAVLFYTLAVLWHKKSLNKRF